MANIKVIDYDESEGALREVYDKLIKERGKLAEVHKVQSLNPESITRHMDLYISLMFGGSPLSRQHREMIAVVVSAANNCKYCILHHSEALLHYWKDKSKVDQLIRNFSKASISDLEIRICEFAWDLTRMPNLRHNDIIVKLRDHGLSDRAILDAALIISYFNFANRIVLGLGVEYKADEIKGYKY